MPGNLNGELPNLGFHLAPTALQHRAQGFGQQAPEAPGGQSPWVPRIDLLQDLRPHETVGIGVEGDWHKCFFYGFSIKVHGLLRDQFELQLCNASRGSPEAFTTMCLA